MIYISQIFSDEELMELLKKTEAGVEIVDLAAGPMLDDLEGSIPALQRRLERLGNPPLTMHGPFLDLNPLSWDPRIAEVSRLRYEQAYRAARALGASTLVFHSCFVPFVNFKEGWADRAVAFYRDFLAGKDGSIAVVMENVFDPSPELFREVAERVDHPAFGICLDIGHAHCHAEAPVEEWLTTLAPWIRHVHVHDNAGDRDAHLALGKGTVHFERLVPLIPREATLTIECNTAADAYATWDELSRTLPRQ